MLPLEKVEWLYAKDEQSPASFFPAFNLRWMPCPRFDSTADWKAEEKRPGPEYETTCNNHIPRSSAVVLLPTKFPSFWTVECLFQYLSSLSLLLTENPLIPPTLQTRAYERLRCVLAYLPWLSKLANISNCKQKTESKKNCRWLVRQEEPPYKTQWEVKMRRKDGNARNCWWFLVFSRLLVRIVVNSKQCVINALSCKTSIYFISSGRRACPRSRWTWSPSAPRRSWWSLPSCRSRACRSWSPPREPATTEKMIKWLVKKPEMSE